MLAVFGVTMLPWFTYNYVTLGRLTLSPAGGFGRGLWEGSWQATWSGRLQNELTHIAEDIDGRADLDRAIERVAAREHLPAAPMLEYVHQWQDIRRIWTEPVDPYERAMSRAKADREYQRVALENLRQDSLAHLARRLARGVFLLWAGEIPFRYSDINRSAGARHSPLLVDTGPHFCRRGRRRARARPREPRGGLAAGGADYLRDCGARSALHRGAPVTAGTAGFARSRHSRDRPPHETPFAPCAICRRTAGS